MYKIPPFFLYILIAVSIFYVAYGAYSLGTTLLLFKNAKKTSGIVVELKTAASNNRKRSTRRVEYIPVVEFATAEGTRVTYTSNVTVNNMAVYPVGTNVPILYQKDNPENARIDSFSQTWAGTFLLPIGLFLFMAGFLGLRTQRKYL
jgi:hypothetical protein